MEKIPKIATERLRAATVAATHPDADLLTAFSEHTLPERERSPILDHLARCSECREVVALALPAQDAAEVVSLPARNPWLTWPRMRWAFVAAGIVAVAAVGLVQFRVTSRQAMVAKLYDVAPAAETRQEKNQPALPEPQASDSESDKLKTKKESPALIAPGRSSVGAGQRADQEFDRLGQAGKLNVSPRDSTSVVGGVVRENTFRGQQLAHGPRPPVQFQQNSITANTNNESALQASAPVAPPPPSPNQQPSKQLVTVPTPAPGSTLGGPLNDKQALDKVAVNERNSMGLQASAASAGAEINRAKPATAANAPQAAPASEAYAVDADRVSNFSPSGPLVAESARWSINAVGKLQRSTDQGRTWQDIDVNSPTGVGNGMGPAIAMKTSRAKVAKDSLDAKVKPIVFRAVSANGPDVWAGGSEGNLYHSTDSGATWVRVVPSWRGIDLTGDILNLQFSDPQHGRIVTAAAEIWTTSDAGQTWDKH